MTRLEVFQGILKNSQGFNLCQVDTGWRTWLKVSCVCPIEQRSPPCGHKSCTILEGKKESPAVNHGLLAEEMVPGPGAPFEITIRRLREEHSSAPIS